MVATVRPKQYKKHVGSNHCLGQKQYKTIQKTVRWSIVWICFGWPRPSVCLLFFWSVFACQKNVYFGRPMPGLFFLFWWTSLRYGFSDVRPGRILRGADPRVPLRAGASMNLVRVTCQTKKRGGGGGINFYLLFYRSYDLCPMTHDQATKIKSGAAQKERGGATRTRFMLAPALMRPYMLL